ncbi:hypothetical protein F353_gp43 [Vibrio phage CP-T1]|uniref:Uncharacterized protein n=1 Tax=Vibrio phage Rostov M3 TaxID=2660724 RepID=A0A5Q2WC79_9CAUD|nr:hypothetical protein F353_gp43 [Vibrio phage CP-T1]AFC22425.1 hypothetical protein CP-T1_0043 [Vibrio phage CP-T1]AIA08721.1 hypothetical protein SBVc24_0032 [Vibrio phage 24]QGH75000.1 hypothetical protein RostovM3_00005 [Vibrio phage Rostov M3]
MSDDDWKQRNSNDAMKLRAMNGLNAECIQSYDEMNKKRGEQWGASRSVSLSTVGEKVYSLIVVGSKTVDLKARILGATGAGVIGRAYLIQSSDVTVNPANADPWYNFRTSFKDTQPETKLYAGNNITFVTPVTSLAVSANKVFADLFAITSTQNQAKGVIPRGFGGNNILEPSDHILLEIESFDATQTAVASLEMFEGDLDYPNDDGL